VSDRWGAARTPSVPAPCGAASSPRAAHPGVFAPARKGPLAWPRTSSRSASSSSAPSSSSDRSESCSRP